MRILLNKTAAFFLAVLLIGAAQPVFAQAITYRQEQLKLIDPDGDEVLLKLFSDTCKTGIKKCITFTNVPPAESQLRVPRFASENPVLDIEDNRVVDNSKAEAMFDMEATLARLKSIMKNGRYKISLGTMHRWALKDFLSAKVVASKILMCLATATSARFMYVGQEVPLINWILSRQDNSVTIEQLFEESYNLNKGNVYLTVLTIENVLSDSTFEADREKTAVNRKLSDLYAGSPNKFGDWYHLFGTMLAGYANEHAEAIADLYGVYRKISRGSNAEKATISADKIGAKMGRQLRQFVFDNDKELQRELVEQIKKRDNAIKYSHGNLKYIGPDGNAYIGFNR